MDPWIIDIDSETHPQALVKAVTFSPGRVDFEWVGSPDAGDQSAFGSISPFSLLADVTAVIEASVGVTVDEAE